MRRTLGTAISDEDDLILHRASDLLDALPWQRVRNLHTPRCMVGLLRHRQTKGPDPAMPHLNRRATLDFTSEPLRSFAATHSVVRPRHKSFGAEQEVTAYWGHLDYPSELSASVRNLWEKRDLGKAREMCARALEGARGRP